MFGAPFIGGCGIAGGGFFSAIFVLCFVVTIVWVLYGLTLGLPVVLLLVFMTLQQCYIVHGGHGLLRTSCCLRM